MARFSSKTFLILGLYPGLLAASELQFRADLASLAKNHLCPASGALAPSLGWTLGIYDADIVGLKIWPKNPKAALIGEPELERAAKSKALNTKHQGYYRAYCSIYSALIASVPAPSPLLRLDSETYGLYDANLGEFCTQIDLDYAAAKGGNSRHLGSLGPLSSKRMWKIETALLEEGTLSLSCMPVDPLREGPKLWFLAPVKGGPASLPEAQLLTRGKSKETDRNRFKTWLNKIRQKEGLAPLKGVPMAIEKVLAPLSSSTQLRHDRTKLRTSRTKLALLGFDLLGENRVQGRSLKTLAWNLWYSPRHRQLLLSPEGSNISLSLKKQGSEHRAVLVLLAKRQTKATGM